MKRTTILTLASASLLWACNTTPVQTEETVDPPVENEEVVAEPEHDAPESYAKEGIKIYPAPSSPQYPGAKLTLQKPESGSKINSGPVAFEFSVEQYELGVQTADAADKELANSAKGQHIHLIVDNSPYSAHYMPGLEKEFEAGTHYAIAFLSRSYHESVKSPGAFQVFQFSTGELIEDVSYDLSQPMLFYSRPKGEYKGADTKKVLFDFYLHNVELAPDGYSVMLTINETLEFEFDAWQPYIIEGLPMGENTFEIKLVDAKGTAVNPTINLVKRTFTLSP